MSDEHCPACGSVLMSVEVCGQGTREKCGGCVRSWWQPAPDFAYAPPPL